MKLQLSQIAVLIGTTAWLSVVQGYTFQNRRLSTSLRMAKDDSPILSSREPQTFSRGGKGRGVFLGFRNVKDLDASQQSMLKSSARPLYPEGGLSPCVIRVLGVGGGGCNAVRQVNVLC
jgi:hypothetical protein